MHLAVAMQSLPMVRILDTYGANANIENMDSVSAIDFAITQDVRDIKLHFMSQSKYKHLDFSARL